MDQAKVSTVAPKELTVKDFGQNIFTFDNIIIPEIDTALRILTTEGHATRGHCGYGGLEFPETSQLDIAKHLFTEDYIQKIRERVTQEIEGTNRFDNELTDILFGIKPESSSRIMNHTNGDIKFADPKTGDPLFGFSLNVKNQFTPSRENILAILRGRAIGNLMDSNEYRDMTVKRFQKSLDGEDLTIGNGSCMVGHLGNIRNKGISLEKLASEVQDPEYIEYLLKQKCLVNNPEKSNSYNPELFSVFVRTTQGLGCCDDLTTLGVGFMHYNQGFEVAKLAYIGSRNSDYVDTVDKFGSHPKNGGSDESHGLESLARFGRLSRKANLNTAQEMLSQDYKVQISLDELDKKLPNEICPMTISTLIHQKTGSVIDFSQHKDIFFEQELVTSDDITTAIYFGAKNNTPNFSESSSVRRFEENLHLTNQDGANTGHRMSVTNSHMNYLRTGEATSGLKIGFKRIESADFYDVANQRLDGFCNLGYFPEPQFDRFGQ
jgi:hypothetical protein